MSRRHGRLRSLAPLICALSAVLILMLAGVAEAARVPPHLVGLVRGLLNDIKDEDFAPYAKSPLKREVMEAIRASRFKSWKGAEATLTPDLAALAGPLGLDPAKPEHRKALAEVLAAGDPSARAEAIAAALKAAGREIDADSIGDARKGFEEALAEATKDLAAHTEIELDDGRKVSFDWDPVSGDLTVTVDHGKDKKGRPRGETVLHGGAVPSLDEEGRLSWKAQADPEPVSYLSPEFRKKIARMVFGIWKDEQGNTWLIRPPGNPAPTVGAPEAPELPGQAAEIEKLREELAALRAKRVYIWKAPDGGRVIQKKYRDLRGLGDYEYLREESRAFFADKIAALEARLKELEGEQESGESRDWFSRYDPLGEARADRRARKRRAISITVIEPGGRRYDYDAAAFDGERITARRILRDVRDITDLPQSIIDQLVASWSPPEWIELAAQYDVRRRTVSLGGKWWRLHVTYSSGLMGIGPVQSIHTPWNRPLRLTWAQGGDPKADDQAVVLRVLTMDGAPLERIEHEVPFVVEAEFLTAKDVADPVMLRIDDEKGPREIHLTAMGDEAAGPSPYRFRSSPLYLRSVQFEERPMDGGLYRKTRFIPEDELAEALAAWKRETEASAARIAADFAGEWHVAERRGRETLLGRATVAEDGRTARLALVGSDGYRRWESLEMRSISERVIELRLARVRAFRDRPGAVPGLKPLLAGQVIGVPTLSRRASFALAGQRVVLPVAMEPAPEEVIRVRLTRRGGAKIIRENANIWGGPAESEFGADAEASSGGRQVWIREPRIRGAVTIEDQTDHRRLSLYYPFRRPDPSKLPSARPIDGPLQQLRRARLARMASRDEGEPLRHILIYGRNLPDPDLGDPIVIESDTDGITYEARSGFVAGPGLTAAGWRKASERDPGLTDPQDYDALVLWARFDETVKPGLHAGRINGMPFQWFLTFPDATARLWFAATPPPEGTPTDLGFAGTVLRLEAELEADLPLGEDLVVTLKTSAADGGIEVPLHRASEAEIGWSDAARPAPLPIYRSPPIHVVPAGAAGLRPPDDPEAIVIEIGGAGRRAEAADGAGSSAGEDDATSRDRGPGAALENAPPSPYAGRDPLGTLYATWEHPELLRVPRPAAVHIFERPEDIGETVWTRALKRARACYPGRDIRITNSNAGEYSRFIITELGSRAVDVTLGDHAAALLIRDEFLKRSAERQRFYGLLKGRALEDFVEKALRHGPDIDPFWKAAKVMIDGEEVVIGDLLKLDLAEAEWPAARAEGGRAFLLRHARRAALDYGRAIRESRKRTIAAGDCDIEHLMVVATQRAPEIVNAILPRLVRAVERDGRRWWEPDRTAQNRVRTLHRLGDEVRALDAYASIDRAVAAMVAAAVTGGAALAVSQLGAISVAAYVTLAGDLLDMAVFGTSDVYDYLEKSEATEFARGASAVFGAGIYEDALEAEPSLFWSVAGVALPGLGALGSLADLHHLSKIREGRAIARSLDRLDPGALKRLSRAQREAFAAYLESMKALERVMDRGGARGALGRALRLNRVKLDDADRAFLKRFAALEAREQKAIAAGWEAGQKLDRMTLDEVARLPARERANLKRYIEDISARREALRRAGFYGAKAIKRQEMAPLTQRVAAITAREEELLRRLGPELGRFDEAAEAGAARRAAEAVEEASKGGGRPVGKVPRDAEGLDDAGSGGEAAEGTRTAKAEPPEGGGAAARRPRDGDEAGSASRGGDGEARGGKAKTEGEGPDQPRRAEGDDGTDRASGQKGAGRGGDAREPAKPQPAGGRSETGPPPRRAGGESGSPPRRSGPEEPRPTRTAGKQPEGDGSPAASRGASAGDETPGAPPGRAPAEGADRPPPTGRAEGEAPGSPGPPTRDTAPPSGRADGGASAPRRSADGQGSRPEAREGGGPVDVARRGDGGDRPPTTPGRPEGEAPRGSRTPGDEPAAQPRPGDDATPPPPGPDERVRRPADEDDIPTRSGGDGAREGDVLAREGEVPTGDGAPPPARGEPGAREPAAAEALPDRGIAEAGPGGRAGDMDREPQLPPWSESEGPLPSLPEGSEITLVDEAGRPAGTVRLGKEIGQGSYNQTLEVAGNEGLVARISRHGPGGLDERLDDFGRRALATIESDAIRDAHRQGPFRVAEGPYAGRRVELVERLPGTAKQQLAENPGGLPTPGQAKALSQAMRDLNAKGYAWLDNHRNNYVFERLGEGDEWRVVVIDPGGIVKMRDTGPGGAAARARDVQVDLARPRPELKGLSRDWVSMAVREEILEEHGRYFDLDAMLGPGASRSVGPEKIGFRGDGTFGFTKVNELTLIDDPAAIPARMKLLRDDPLAASGLSVTRLEEVRSLLREQGFAAVETLSRNEAGAVRRAVRRVAERLDEAAGSGGPALTAAERELRGIASRMLEGARDADRAWREAPPPESLPPRRPLLEWNRDAKIERALDESGQNLEAAEFRRDLAAIADEPGRIPDAARAELEDSAARLAFRRKVLDQIDEARREVNRADSRLWTAREELTRIERSLDALDEADPANAARRAELTARQAEIEAEIAEVERRIAPQRAVFEKTTERDLEWLSGNRFALTDGEKAEALATIERNGSRWAAVLKDKTLSPGELHQVVEYRRTVVDGMLDDIIAEVRGEGQTIERLAFGSNNLTSDYDLSIRVEGGGPGAAEVVRRFNARFRERFGAEPGLVFDTNVYTEPAYTFLQAPRGGRAGRLSPVQEDALRQQMFRETAARRYMSDREWEAHKTRLLEAANADEKVALEHVFGQVERNFDAVGRQTRARQAALAGGEARLQAMETRRAALAEAARRGPLTPSEAKELKRLERELQQYALRAANETYAEVLSSIEEFTAEYQRLARLDLSDPRALDRLSEVTPAIARTTPGSDELGAYGRQLEALKADLARADALRRAGRDPGPAIEAAAARRAEMMATLAEQARNRQGQALFYASEAYQTEGAIAHVVGELQAGGRKVTVESLRGPRVESRLSAEQYFDSFGENRANMFKEVAAARDPVTGRFGDARKAAAKASKYMIRQLDAAHQGGIDLAAALPDQRVIDATVLVEANRGDLDAVARVLEDIGMSAEEYVALATRASDALDVETFRLGALRRKAAAIAEYVRFGEEDVAALLREAERATPAVELRRSPAALARRESALGVLDSLEEEGLEAFGRLPARLRDDLAGAIEDVRDRLARGGAEQLDAADRRLLEAADRLVGEGDSAVRAWREGPQARPARDLELNPGQGLEQASRALKAVSKRLDRARALARIAGEGAPEARARFLEAANDLAFRKKVLESIHEQIAAERQAEKAVDEARAALAEARADHDQTAVRKAEEALSAAKARRRAVLDRARPVTRRDIEWLSGSRGRLSAEEAAAAEAALARNGYQWQKLLKDPKVGPAELHRLTVWRKQVVDDMLRRIIDQEAARIGRRPAALAFGSNNLTSDYDLSIRVEPGPGSARVVRRFNQAFRERFGAESGVVFDTNVYTEPAYSWVSAADTTRRGAVAVDPREADRIRQAIFRETKIRRFASDADWARHRALTLEGLAPAERQAFRYVLDEAEANVARAREAVEAGMRRAAGRRGDDLDQLRAERAAALEAGDEAKAAEIGAKLENYALEAANERYADILEEIDDNMRALHRLQTLKVSDGPQAIRGVAAGLPNLREADRIALRSRLARAAELVEEARRLEAGGETTAALLRRAEAEAALGEAASRLARTARTRQGEALYYASEAYFTEGAIKHVVGELQAGGRRITVESLSAPALEGPLGRGAYLDSFYENRGDLLKEIAHYRRADGSFSQPAKAAAKVSKYFIRQLDAAHRAGIDLSLLGDARLIEATVRVDAVRGDLAAVERTLSELGLTPQEFADDALRASDTLTRAAVERSLVRAEAGVLAAAARTPVALGAPE